MRVCWGVKAIYGLQGGVLSTRTPFWAPHPCGHPPTHTLLQPRPRFSGSGVGPGEHTQVPLGVRVQLQVQGPTLPDVALYNKHGVFVILQPGLGVALHCSVLHLPWQGQLQLFPKI